MEQADPGTAAALSDDDAMLADYMAGDFCAGFALNTGALASLDDPRFPQVRALYKPASCALMYGTGLANLSELLGGRLDMAKSITRRHKSRYWKYWKCVQQNIDEAAINGLLRTSSGWMQYNLRPRRRSASPFRAWALTYSASRASAWRRRATLFGRTTTR
ncbi:MAG TPA: hypothetical protein VM925_36255 [Labilithrix sp.]|nr:hypothetical protein [Labilithrix sp.]